MGWRDREVERERRREYDGDVFYDVWKSGRNPDRIDYDRVSNHYYDGHSAQEAAAHEIRIQRHHEQLRIEQRQLEEQQEHDREYYHRMEQLEADHWAELEAQHYQRMERFDEYGYYR